MGSRDTFKVVDDTVLDVLLAKTETAPSGCKDAVVIMLPLGGAMSRIPIESTAFGHRQGKYWFICLAKWENPSARPACVAWMKDLKSSLMPWVAGTYNTLAALEGSDMIAYGKGPNAKRLAELKAKYDPTNFLRQNNNIIPAGMKAESE
jgi:hypothetical protein